ERFSIAGWWNLFIVELQTVQSPAAIIAIFTWGASRNFYNQRLPYPFISATNEYNRPSRLQSSNIHGIQCETERAICPVCARSALRALSVLFERVRKP